MRRDFLSRLRCPVCRRPALAVAAIDAEDDREIRAGALRCGDCGETVTIADGIVHALRDPPAFVRAEADGLARFAEAMRADGWTAETILGLPWYEDGYWAAQRVLFDQTLREVPFRAGDMLLDIGANTCWASAKFAQLGLEVTALDITTTMLQGLETAEVFFEAEGLYFERVLGVMFDLPFADASFDHVWCSQVLHHNDRRHLLRTYREIHRVLKPGGRLIVANEPLRSLASLNLRPGREVEQFDGHEHVYARGTYTALARRAGFEVDVRGPAYRTLWDGKRFYLTDQQRFDEMVRSVLVMMARRSSRASRLLLTIRSYLLGKVALHMLCRKPG